MARVRDTFAAYDTGAGTLTGWTALDTTNATLTIATDAGSEGGQVLEIAKSGAGRGRITFDRVTSATEQDVVMEFEVDATGRAPGLIINASGGSGVEVEYLLEVFGTALTIWEAAGSGYTSRSTNASALGSALDTGAVYAMRLRRQGNIIYGRIWIPASEDEPAAWDVSYTDSGSPRSAGAAGISYPTTAGTLTVHYFSAGTGGDCGCVLADEDLPLVGPALTSSTDGSVRLSNAAGTVHAVIAIFGDATAANIRAVEAHHRDREFYVTARATNTVHRINRFGLSRASVITTITDPYGLAVDSVADDIYVSGRAVSIIYKSDLYALSPSAWKTPGGSNFPGYIYVDADNDRIYWADHSGVYAADPDGTNEVDFDTLSEELAVTSDGTTVYAADYTSAGGVYTKPVASPGDSWTAADTTSIIESLALNGDKDELYGAESVGGTIVKWSSLPPSAGNRTTFATLEGARYVSWFDFTAEAWPADALLIAAYELDDATDSIGSNDLTESGSPAYVSAVVGNGVDLEESSSQKLTRAVASAGDLIPGLLDLTAVAWWKSESLPASSYVPIVAFGYDKNPGLDPGYGINLDSSGQLLPRVSDGTTQKAFTASGTPYAAGNQYHGALSISRAGNARMHVNGAQVGSASVADYVATDLQPTIDFRIGGNYNTRYFDGVIDEVLIFRRAISLWEERHLYNEGTGRALSSLQSTGYPVIASQRAAISNDPSVTDLSNDAPAGVTAGDLLLYIFGADQDTGTITAPVYDGGANDTSTAGFTQHLSDGSTGPSSALYSKTATSDDADQSSNGDGYNVAWSTIEGAASTILRITGHDGVDVVSSIVSGSTTTRPVSPGVVTTVNNCLVLDVLIVDDNNPGALGVVAPDYSAVILNEYHATPGAAGGAVMSVAARHQATAGDTGAARWTIDAARSYVAFSVAIAPAATGVTGAAADTIELSDTAAATLAAVAAALDGVTLTDTASVAAALLAAAADGLDLGDVALAIAAYVTAGVDGLVLSDAATAIVSGAGLVTGAGADTVTFADNAAAQAAFLAANADGLDLGDAATVLLGVLGASADALDFGDAATALVGAVGTSTDGLSMGDSATAILSLLATASDGLTLGDAASIPRDAAYVIASVSLANAIAGSVTIQNAINATASINPD